MMGRFPRVGGGGDTGNSSRVPKKARMNPIQRRAVEEEKDEFERIHSPESEGTFSPSRSRSPSPSEQQQSEFEPDDDVQEEQPNLQRYEALMRFHNNNNNNNVNSGVTLSNSRVLDCPRCLAPLAPPVYQCDNGHFICAQCSNTTRKKCPTCSTTIKNNPCRGIEMIIQSAKTPCENLERGCMAKLSYGTKNDHQKYCRYASCSCPLLSCSYSDTCFELYKHFGLRHPNTSRMIQFNSATWIVLRRGDDKVFLQDGDEKVLFVLNRRIVPLGNLIHLICLGPCSISVKYTYELTANSGGRKIMLKTFVDSTPQLIAEQSLPKENCLVITNAFANTVGELRLELIIRRC